MRILHVEDDEDTRTLVAFVLQAEGWHVVSVDSAKAAIAMTIAGAIHIRSGLSGRGRLRL